MAQTEMTPSPSDEELLARAGIVDLPPPEEGLFPGDSWLRQVSAEPVLLSGGIRALLLEIAHPLVAAGVAEHSNFRADPFGRLQRTLDAMNAIAFKDRAAALDAVRTIERVHERIRGRLAHDAGRFRAGTPYHGRDPELVRWVWATLCDTALVVYERFVSVLDEAGRGAYYEDHRVMARLLGVPPALVPPTYGAFRSYFDEMLESDTLSVTPTAREIGDAVLNPPGGLQGRGVVHRITAALLPERLRHAFGLSWDETQAAKLEALTASVRALRRRAAG